MSTRLTVQMRASISQSILEHRFREPVDAMIADRKAFAEEVYNDVYRKADRERMADLPEGWLPEITAVNVQFGDGSGYVSLEFAGRIYGRLGSVKTSDGSEQVTRRGHSKRVHGCAKVYDRDHRLAKKHADLSQRLSDLKAEFEAAARKRVHGQSSCRNMARS